MPRSRASTQLMRRTYARTRRSGAPGPRLETQRGPAVQGELALLPFTDGKIANCAGLAACRSKLVPRWTSRTPLSGAPLPARLAIGRSRACACGGGPAVEQTQGAGYGQVKRA